MNLVVHACRICRQPCIAPYGENVCNTCLPEGEHLEFRPGYGSFEVMPLSIKPPSWLLYAGILGGD